MQNIFKNKTISTIVRSIVVITCLIFVYNFIEQLLTKESKGYSIVGIVIFGGYLSIEVLSMIETLKKWLETRNSSKKKAKDVHG